MIRTFVRCLRLDLLPLGIAGVIGGTACAAYMGNLDVLSALIAMLFVCVVQLTSNLLHRYVDEAGNYGENRAEGVRAPEGLPSLKQLLREASFGMGVVSIMLGFTVLAMTGWWFAALGVTLAVLMYFYAAAPRPLSQSGLNPLLFFFTFGPLCVGATCLMQTKSVEEQQMWIHDMMPAIWVSIGIGLYAVNMLIADQYDSARELGREIHRNSILRFFGARATCATYIVNGVIAAAVIWPYAHGLSLPNAMAVLAVPAACAISNAVVGCRICAAPQTVDPDETPLVKITAINMLVYATGLLVSGIILGIHLSGSHAHAYFT